MENIAENKILSKYKMPPRKLNITKLARTGKTTIRKYAGVAKTKGLVEKYKTIIPDVYLLFEKAELEKEAYKYFGELYNKSLIDATPTITIKPSTTTRYSGQLSFKVEVKRSGGYGKLAEGGKRSFFTKAIDVPLLTMKEVKQLEQREIAKLLSQSAYLSIEPLRENIIKQRIHKPLNSVMTMPIKSAGTIDLDGLIKNSVWCKNNGMCVPDWLIHKYYDCPRSKIKKKVKDVDIIEYHSTHDLDGQRVYSNRPNKDGYTIENIMLFCKNANLPVYILHNGSLIKHSRNEAVGHTKSASPLVIEVKNGHLYPITNATEIKRIVHMPHSSGVKVITKEQEEQKSKEKVPPNLCFDCEYDDAIGYYLHTQRKLNTQNYPNKARLTGQTLAPFKIGDITYVSATKDIAIEEYLKLRNKQYAGQSAPSLIGVYMEKMPQSYLNHEVMDALTRRGVKNRTHIGLYQDYEEDEEQEEGWITPSDDDVVDKSNLPKQIDLSKVICLDINKAYRDVMERPPDDLMTLGFNSLIEDVKKFSVKKFGLWFVETDDLTLLHQSNWYSSTILTIAHKEGIKFKPKYFIAGKKEGKVLLNTMIQEISDNNPNNDPEWKEQNPDISEDLNRLIKTMINSISGMLGRTTRKTTTLTCDTDIERVWEDYFKKPKKWETDFIFRSLEADATNPALYCWGRVQNQELLTNNLPMYIQILDWANIKLHNLIKSMGGYEHLLYRKTDFIMMENIGQVLTPTDDVGGYKIEDPPSRYINMDDARSVDYEYTRVDMVKDAGINTSDDYDKVIARLESGKSLLLDSRAGTGKSYVINKVSEHFGEKGVRRIAFTNKASNNINGQTIHKFFGIDKASTLNLQQLRKRMGGVKVVCIDEISMIGQALWKHIYFVKKYFSDVVFLLCGEEAQLPPIEENDLIDGYFKHPTIMMMCDYTYASLILTDKCRYDRVLYDYLTNIKDEKRNPPRPVRNATLEDYLSGTNLVYTNKRRMSINTILNKYYSLQATEYLLAEWEKEDEEVVGEKYRQTTMIYVGLPLLVFAMDTINGLIKNTIHIVKSVDITTATFTLEDNTGEFVVADINKKFIMAYATTIHKAQGDTIDGQLNIHEYHRIKDNKRLYYTAVSRGRTLENIKYYT